MVTKLGICKAIYIYIYILYGNLLYSEGGTTARGTTDTVARGSRRGRRVRGSGGGRSRAWEVAGQGWAAMVVAGGGCGMAWATMA
jgi:hypothetical protein